MKTMKKLSAILLTMVLCIASMAIPAFASSVSQDGLNIVLTTDKEEYAKAETIVATLSVENTNDFAVTDVSLKGFIPEGYKLAADSTALLELEALEAGETKALTFKLLADVPATENPDTGDSSNTAMWAVLLIISGMGAAMLFVYSMKNKKAQKVLSLALCLAVAGGTIGGIAVKASAAEAESKIAAIETTVKVDGVDLAVKGEVKYEFDADKTIKYTRAEWIQLLVESCGYPETGEITTPSYPDIEGMDYQEAVEKAVSYGLLIPDGNEFNPDAPATREFAAVTAIRCMGYRADTEILCEDAENITYLKETALAVEIGLLSLEGNKFYPQRQLNKVEADHILTVIEETYNTAGNDDEDDSDSDNSGSDDDRKGFVFRDGVVVLDKNTEYEDNGTTVKLALTDDLCDLQKDTIVVIGTSKAYKVISSSIEDDCVIITYSTPELAEFLETIDVEGNAKMDFSKFEPAEGVTVNYNSAQNNVQPFGFMDDAFDLPNTSVNVGADIVLEGDIDLGNDWSFNYSLKQAIPSVSYKFDIDFSLAGLWSDEPVANVKNAYVKMQEKTSLTVGFGKDIDGSDHGAVVRDDLLYKYIPLGRVPLLGVDGIGVVVEIDLVMNAQGTFEVQYNVGGTLGCQILNNRPRNISALQSSVSAGAAAEIKIGPKVGVVAEVFEKDLLSFSADAGVRIGGSVNVRSTGLICLDAGITLYAELNAFEDTLIDDWLDIKLTWEIWNEHTSPLKIKYHSENMVRVDECTYEGGGTIKGTVSEADNHTHYIKDAEINVYDSSDMSLKKNVKSDASGQYKATVPGGTYLIKISADGYIPFECLQTVMDQQEIYMETFLMVEGDENTSETGTIGGTITNSVTGASIDGVKLTIRKGWNITEGTVAASVTTDGNGSYNVELPLGNYTILMEKDGYVTNHINAAVTKRTNLNQHGTLVPDGESSIPTGDLRIVLTWGQTPSDLDSHLYGPAVDGGSFHTFYANGSYSYNGETQAFLDVDDTSSYGPETTTVYSMNQSGIYSFYVHDYSNRYSSSSTEMANSGAKIQVYAGEELVATYNIPTSGVGNVWHVFDFDANTRQLIAVNRFYSESNPNYVGTRDTASVNRLNGVYPFVKASENHEQTKTPPEVAETTVNENVETVDSKNEAESLDPPTGAVKPE